MNKEKILIIDDTPNNIDILHQILKHRYQVFCAPDGHKALELANRHLPDLILLDIMMPVMDGYQVCKLLRRNPETVDIPVIFLSALTNPSDKLLAFEAGGVDYIIKPFQAVEVLARIENQLRIKVLQKELLEKNTQLDEQNIKLREAAKLRDDVEQITQHDLKMPINSILDLCNELLEEENITPEQKKKLGVIETAAFNMLNLLNTSLDLYKIEMGDYEFNLQAVDIIELFDYVIKSFSMILKEKNIAVQVFLEQRLVKEEDVFILNANQVLFYSILSNLVRNAIEASPENQMVKIKLEYSSEKALIQIQNQGSVPEEIKDKLFDKYVTAGKLEGNGLGAYSAKMMVEIQGGEIYCDMSYPNVTIINILMPV